MMQKKVQIISDGSLDLSQELTKEKDMCPLTVKRIKRKW